LPVVHPPPRVEFGAIAATEIDTIVHAQEFEQKPDLFLAPELAIRGLAIRELATGRTAPQRFREIVVQPVAGPAQHPHMALVETDLLMQLAKQGGLGYFVRPDAALRELPSVPVAATPPENLPLAVDQDDADIGPVTLCVDHGGIRCPDSDLEYGCIVS